MSAKKNEPINLAAFQVQLDVSLGIARSLVASWLPPPRANEEQEDDQQESVPFSTIARPARVGLGAKFLTHTEATRHLPAAAFESKVKRKILGSNQKRSRGEFSYAAEDEALDSRYSNRRAKNGKWSKNYSTNDEEEEEQDSRVSMAGRRRKSVLASTANSDDASKKMQHRESNKKKSQAVAATSKNAIGGGDFLSMYLNEREKKKRKNNNNNNNSNSNSNNSNKKEEEEEEEESAGRDYG